jgi:hypothetical protein
MRTQNRTRAAAATAKGEELDRRAIEAAAELGLTEPMRRAALELAKSWGYEEAAEEAGTTPEIVRGWTLDPNFVMAVGWIVIGMADNPE